MKKASIEVFVGFNDDGTYEAIYSVTATWRDGGIVSHYALAETLDEAVELYRDMVGQSLIEASFGTV